MFDAGQLRLCVSKYQEPSVSEGGSHESTGRDGFSCYHRERGRNRSRCGQIPDRQAHQRGARRRYAGKLVGIVTEADLMHRVEIGTERPYSRWLHLISGDRAFAADYVKTHAVKVKDVMTRDVKTRYARHALVRNCRFVRREPHQTRSHRRQRRGSSRDRQPRKTSFRPSQAPG